MYFQQMAIFFCRSLIWLKEHGLYLIICKIYLYINRYYNLNVILHPVLTCGGSESITVGDQTKLLSN